MLSCPLLARFWRGRPCGAGGGPVPRQDGDRVRRGGVAFGARGPRRGVLQEGGFVEGGGSAEPIFQRGNKWIFNTMTAVDYQHSRNLFEWIQSLPADRRPKTATLTYHNSLRTLILYLG